MPIDVNERPRANKVISRESPGEKIVFARFMHVVIILINTTLPPHHDQWHKCV